MQLDIVNRTSGIEFSPNPKNKMAAMSDYIADSALKSNIELVCSVTQKVFDISSSNLIQSIIYLIEPLVLNFGEIEISILPL